MSYVHYTSCTRKLVCTYWYGSSAASLRLSLTLELTDVQPKNILLGVLDDACFARYERDELNYPMPRKELSTRTVYVSRPMPLSKGAPLLCDFSEARFETSSNVDLVMPDVYRAPEVVLGMPWSYPIDLWGFAMTVCFFRPKQHPFVCFFALRNHLVDTGTAVGPFRAETTV
jgi:serine/threonine protein kinase